MIGTLINVATILVGSTLGIIFGARFPERARQTITSAMGLFIVALGLQMFIKTKNPLIVLGSLLLGGLLGEWWQIEESLKKIGRVLERRFAPNGETDTNPAPEVYNEPSVDKDIKGTRFIRGFLTASLVFAIGPMAILGSIQDGLNGDYYVLAIKSILDGFASLAFASSLGIGVLFSSLIILVYQGSISLLAAQAQALVNPGMMNELTATGGILLLGIAFSSLLEIKTIRTGNLLPALFIAPIIVAILQGLHFY